MKQVLSLIYPDLRVIDLGVKFEDGVAWVPANRVDALLRLSQFGLVLAGEEPQKVESAKDEDEEPKRVGVPIADVKIPAVRETVPVWVEFMAANGIDHPLGATKGEMKALAESHFGEA